MMTVSGNSLRVPTQPVPAGFAPRLSFGSVSLPVAVPVSGQHPSNSQFVQAYPSPRGQRGSSPLRPPPVRMQSGLSIGPSRYSHPDRAQASSQKRGTKPVCPPRLPESSSQQSCPTTPQETPRSVQSEFIGGTSAMHDYMHTPRSAVSEMLPAWLVATPRVAEEEISQKANPRNMWSLMNHRNAMEKRKSNEGVQRKLSEDDRRFAAWLASTQAAVRNLKVEVMENTEKAMAVEMETEQQMVVVQATADGLEHPTGVAEAIKFAEASQVADADQVAKISTDAEDTVQGKTICSEEGSRNPLTEAKAFQTKFDAYLQKVGPLLGTHQVAENQQVATPRAAQEADPPKQMILAYLQEEADRLSAAVNIAQEKLAADLRKAGEDYFSVSKEGEEEESMATESRSASKAAEEMYIAAEKKVEEKWLAAEAAARAEEERIAAEKQAQEEKLAAELAAKAAEEERIAAEKKALKERAAAEMKAKAEKMLAEAAAKAQEARALWDKKAEQQAQRAKSRAVAVKQMKKAAADLADPATTAAQQHVVAEKEQEERLSYFSSFLKAQEKRIAAETSKKEEEHIAAQKRAEEERRIAVKAACSAEDERIAIEKKVEQGRLAMELRAHIDVEAEAEFPLLSSRSYGGFSLTDGASENSTNAFEVASSVDTSAELGEDFASGKKFDFGIADHSLVPVARRHAEDAHAPRSASHGPRWLQCFIPRRRA